VAPAGSLPAGNARWGHADLAGNVGEWVRDWYGDRPATCKDCINLAPGASRIYRGGGYDSFPGFLDNTNASSGAPTMRSDTLGFRCARAL
jgi:formylglycine-generating enzyme required for sulfatase activity